MDIQNELLLTSSFEDWLVIRDIYVYSFSRYPLYKYMVPDDTKREAFLRTYLDANYDVTVGSGQGIVIKMNVTSPDDGEVKIIGGILCVPPASDGCGWAIGSDEPYWKAYEKHGLADISKEGLERVKRYEAWENTRIASSLFGCRIPMWNGLFCAMSLDFASKGLGSNVYQDALHLITEHIEVVRKKAVKASLSKQKASDAEKRQKPSITAMDQPVISTRPDGKHSEDDFAFRCSNSARSLTERARLERSGDLRRNSAPETGHFESLCQSLFKSCSWKDLNPLGPSNGRVKPTPGPDKPLASNGVHSCRVTKDPRPIETTNNGVGAAPLVIAITHSDRSSRFHASNGFHPIGKVPYRDPVDGIVHFYTHVLVLDPFRSGRSACLDRVLAQAPDYVQDLVVDAEPPKLSI